MAESELVDMEVKKSFIRKQPVFSQLTNEEIDILASLLSEKRFSPGDTIVTEGDHVDSVYFIFKGKSVLMHFSFNNGTTHIDSVAVLNEGVAIGLNETGFYSLSGVRTATVCAISPMVTLRLSLAAFHGFALSNSHVNTIMRQHASKMMGFPTNID